jgi:hypothetical protein
MPTVRGADRALAWLVLCAALVGSGACSRRKAECEKLASVINSIRLELPAGDEQAALESLSEQAHRAAADLGRVELEDARLVSLRERYRQAADGYTREVRALAQGLGELSSARAEGADAGVRRAIKERTTARHEAARRFAQQTSSVTSELNAYCSNR